MERVIFRILDKELRLIYIVGDKSPGKDFKNTFQYMKLVGDDKDHWYARDLLMVPMDYLSYEQLEDQEKREAKKALIDLFEEGIYKKE